MQQPLPPVCPGRLQSSQHYICNNVKSLRITRSHAMLRNQVVPSSLLQETAGPAQCQGWLYWLYPGQWPPTSLGIMQRSHDHGSYTIHLPHCSILIPFIFYSNCFSLKEILCILLLLRTHKPSRTPILQCQHLCFSIHLRQK